MIRRIASIGLLLATLLPSAASAQEGIVDSPTDPACIRDLYRAFGREHRLSRAVLFGRPGTGDAPVASVFYDAQGNAWAKTGPDEWKSAADGMEDETYSNAQMAVRAETDPLCQDNEGEVEASCVHFPRRGYFEVRKTPTSDLIHPIVQTVRALQCRLRAVCDVASLSPGKRRGELITVTNDGCLPLTYPVMEGCREIDPDIFGVRPGDCQSARRELVRREMELLTLAVSYDANYRSLAQFAGMFQEFLTQFRFPLIEPLWQTVRVLGGLKDIPCFSAECNE